MIINKEKYSILVAQGLGLVFFLALDSECAYLGLTKHSD
jgi:hypothetical protein